MWYHYHTSFFSCMKKILVTGGAGFIGSNLCEQLLKNGDAVFCLDNFFSSSEKNVSEFLTDRNFTLLKHDIVETLPKSLYSEYFDQIYHLACPASPVKYQKDHVYTLKVNFLGTLNVLNFAKQLAEKHGTSPKVLFSSTSEVYGDPLESPQNEEYRGNVNPHGIRSCYDEGKRVSESLCMNFWKQYKIPVKIIRVFNTYGPKMSSDDGRAVSNFIVQALKGENLTVFGDGNQTRSFQYIDDLILGMASYMNLDEEFPGPINLGNPNEITILELAKKIIAITKSASKIDFQKLPKDDPLQRCPDISLAKKKLNFAPSVGLDEGLKKTIEYFSSIV